MGYAERKLDTFLLRLRNRRDTFLRVVCIVIVIFLAGVGTGLLSR